MEYKLSGRKFDYKEPITVVAEILGWKTETVKKRRKESLRLQHSWHTVDWATADIAALALELNLPPEDVVEMKKMVAREKKKNWPYEDYEQSDETIAAKHGVKEKTVQYYRQFYDKNYSGKPLVKEHLISVRLRPDMYDALVYQVGKTGYKLPEFVRLILMKHLDTFPFYSDNPEDRGDGKAAFISKSELYAFWQRLSKLG